jgi:hypothetical protein
LKQSKHKTAEKHHWPNKTFGNVKVQWRQKPFLMNEN